MAANTIYTMNRGKKSQSLCRNTTKSRAHGRRVHNMQAWSKEAKPSAQVMLIQHILPTCTVWNIHTMWMLIVCSHWLYCFHTLINYIKLVLTVCNHLVSYFLTLSMEFNCLWSLTVSSSFSNSFKFWACYLY